MQFRVHAAKTVISEENPTWRITGTKLEKILNIKLVYLFPKKITQSGVPRKVSYQRVLVQFWVSAAKTVISEQNPTWGITGTKLEKILNMKLVY